MIRRLSNGRYDIGNCMTGHVDAETARMALEEDFIIHAGSINKQDGRVRISVRGRFPGCPGMMYALRSRVVWWLRTGEVLIGDDVDIHHENTDRTDDCFDNLQRLTHVEHAKLHNPQSASITICICKTCDGTFPIKTHRLRDPSRGRYCSQVCYQLASKSGEQGAKTSASLRLAYAEGRR